ncbi:MAG: outer membrane protein assembly factor BamD [Candidatus Aegiribacteria sp.]|nr:outer membrane protein assembly factor BamD [Candidatus Aegiribacteria sp.]
MRTNIALLLAALLLASACGRSYNTTGMNLEQLEELADEAFGESDFSGASRLYTELMFMYPGSSEIDFYLYRLGMAEAGNRYWADALFYFDRVEREFARSQWADDCAYQSAMVWWNQRQDYRKDLTPVLNCRVELENFFDAYPGSLLLEDALSLMDDVNGHLARRALFIGQFYARRDKYDASLFYLREALNDYGETDCTAEVLISLGDIYFVKGNQYTAREFYQRAMDECELSEEQVTELQSRLDEL